MNARTLLRAALVVLALLVVALAVLGSFASELPLPQGDRIDLRDHALGVSTGGSFAYVVRSVDGASAVVVDTGTDPELTAVKGALAGFGLALADVEAVLLTHGHFDHTAGLAAVPADVPVYVHPADVPLVRGQATAKGTLPSLMGPHRAVPDDRPLTEVGDGAVLDLGGRSWTVLHVPGHTGGSVAYAVGELVFAGDALAAKGDGVAPLPGLFADDPAQSRASVARIAEVDFDVVADGHVGKAEGAKAKLDAYLAR